METQTKSVPHGALVLVEETDSKLVNKNVILGGKGFKE